MCVPRGSSLQNPPRGGRVLALPASPYAHHTGVQVNRVTPCDGSSVAYLNPFEPGSPFEDDLSVDLPDELAQFWAVASQLKEFSSLFASLGPNEVDPAKLAALALKAVRGRLRSSASIRSALGHLRSFVEFFNSNELSDTACVCGPSSLMALRDFLESLHVRGVTVPRTARAALNVFKTALGLDWPLDHPLISAVVTCDDAPPPKHAPSFSLDLLFKFTSMTEDPMVCVLGNDFLLRPCCL